MIPLLERFINRLLNPFKRKPLAVDDPILYSIDKGLCPDCGGDKFIAGPSGGSSMNMECASCGSNFNVAIAYNEVETIEIQHPLMMAERIGWNESGRWSERGKRKVS